MQLFFTAFGLRDLKEREAQRKNLSLGLLRALSLQAFVTVTVKKKKKNLSPKNQLLQSKVTINLLGGKKEKKIFTDFPKIRQTI